MQNAFFLYLRPLWSKSAKKTPFFKTFLRFPKMDIYKCPKSISLLDFCFYFVTEKNTRNSIEYFVTIYHKDPEFLIVTAKIAIINNS